jgi:hypothetical protein
MFASSENKSDRQNSYVLIGSLISLLYVLMLKIWEKITTCSGYITAWFLRFAGSSSCFDSIVQSESVGVQHHVVRSPQNVPGLFFFICYAGITVNIRPS